MTAERRDDEPRRWGSVLAQCRAKARMTQETLASLCGVSHATIRRWERDESVPAEDNWPALERTLPGLPRPSRAEAVPDRAPEAAGCAAVPPRVATPVEEPAPPEPARPPTYEEMAAEVRQLRELATIDPLTGISNRRAVGAALERAIRAAHRRGETLAVCQLDVDHFKKLNDTHGHQAGDEVLKAVAAALAGSVREHDVVGRMGGEEFLAILEAVPAQRARVLAERMRALVQALNVGGITCTVSVGVAVYSALRRPLKDDEPEQLARTLIERADKALYWAKQDGRNRVELWAQDAEQQRAEAAQRAAQAQAAVARQAELTQAADAMLAKLKPGRKTVAWLGRAAACVGLLFGTGSFMAGDGCGGSGIVCGPGTCNNSGSCIPCGPATDTSIDR